MFLLVTLGLKKSPSLAKLNHIGVSSKKTSFCDMLCVVAFMYEFVSILIKFDVDKFSGKNQ